MTVMEKCPFLEKDQFERKTICGRAEFGEHPDEMRIFTVEEPTMAPQLQATHIVEKPCCMAATDLKRQRVCLQDWLRTHRSLVRRIEDVLGVDQQWLENFSEG